MLVLTRRLGQTIVIDDNISITVLAASGDRVRLGINAPRDVAVDRQEIHDRRSQSTGESGQSRVAEFSL